LRCAGCDFARFIHHSRIDFNQAGFDKRGIDGFGNKHAVRASGDDFSKADNGNGCGGLLACGFLGSHFQNSFEGLSYCG
jgi:hypothetical protein